MWNQGIVNPLHWNKMVSRQARCPICSDNFPSNNHLRSHITQIHSHTDIFTVTDTNYNSQKLFLCRHCNNNSINIYLTEGNLKRHIHTKHPTAIRTTTNIELLNQTIPNHSDNTNIDWNDALQFLTNVNIHKPPPFRRTAWSKITKAQKRKFIVLYDLSITLFNESLHPFISQHRPNNLFFTTFLEVIFHHRGPYFSSKSSKLHSWNIFVKPHRPILQRQTTTTLQ